MVREDKSTDVVQKKRQQILKLGIIEANIGELTVIEENCAKILGGKINVQNSLNEGSHTNTHKHTWNCSARSLIRRGTSPM